jgi:hypothetical protein
MLRATHGIRRHRFVCCILGYPRWDHCVLDLRIYHEKKTADLRAATIDALSFPMDLERAFHRSAGFPCCCCRCWAPPFPITCNGDQQRQILLTSHASKSTPTRTVTPTILDLDHSTATVVGGSWSTSVTLSGNGTHSIVAQDTDAAGNTGSSTPVNFTLSIIANGWANPAGGSWNTGANWSSGTEPVNTANVVFDPIGAVTPYDVTVLQGAAVAANSITLNDPYAGLFDDGSLTIVASLVMISGYLEIDNGGTLSLGGSPSFTVDFGGTGGNLLLGNSPGFTGTINAVSMATGPVTVSGSGDQWRCYRSCGIGRDAEQLRQSSNDPRRSDHWG